jgi:outer membrane protein assembly factor BamB
MPDASLGSTRLSSHRCPECGAPVDFHSAPPDHLQIRCGYCGAFIPIPGRKATPPRPAPRRPIPAATIVVTGDGRKVKGGWGCGLATSILASILAIIVAVLVFIEVDAGALSQMLPWGTLAPPRLVSAPIALGGDDSAAVQLVVAAYEESGSRLIGFDPAARREGWRSPRMSERWYEQAIVAGASHVYVADGAELIALDRGDGTVVWRTSLANNLQTVCPDHAPCLHLLRGAPGDAAALTLAALTRDGTVQAFDAATGAPRWSRRLNTTPRQLLAAGSRVMVIDGDERNRALVLALDGLSGAPVFELRPVCRTNDFDRAASPHDRYLLTPDRDALIVAASGHAGCAWRYDLTDGRETWRYVPSPAPGERPASALPFAWATASSLVDNRTLYIVNDQGQTTYLFALDTLRADTPPRLVYSVDRYDLTLEATLGERLLVSAAPDYARNEVELWAIDPGQGERVWQRPLGLEHAFDKWAARLTNQGLFVGICTWEDSACRFEMVDPVFGVSSQSVRHSVGRSYSGATWIGDTGYFVVGGKVFAVDLAAGRVAYSWP